MKQRRSNISLFLAVMGILTFADGPLSLHLFNMDANPNAQCLDGSPAGFYHSINPAESRWVIYLEGGGLCVEPVDCEMRKKQREGSSTFWKSTHNDADNVCSFSPENPFRDWNKVWVPYCSGDTWIGIQNKTNVWNLQFSGHHIVDAVVRYVTNFTVTKLLLTGQSAGGIGTMQNADFVGARLRNSVSNPVDYWASPQAGFYFPSEDLIMYPEMDLDISVPFAPIASAYLYDFFGKPFLDESCMAAHRLDPHQCWNADVHYPHVETPLFFAQNMYDSNQIGAVLGVDWWPLKNKEEQYKEYFGEKMRQHLGQGVKERDGLFMPSCYQHTDNLCMLQRATKVQNLSYSEMLVDWMFGQGKVSHQAIDDCVGNLPCNPNCEC